MLNRYIDFELTFQPNNGGQIFFQAESETDGNRSGYLAASFPDDALRTLITQLRADELDEDGVTALGRQLFAALFLVDEVRGLFYRTQGAQNEGVGIRLKLRTAPDDTVVSAVPWEYLYDPDRESPFVLQDISVVRYPQAAAKIPNLETKLPLRVLLTAAQPTDLPDALVDRELDAVLASLRDRGLDASQIEVIEERHLTRSRLQGLLRQRFHVWHFAGHGGFSRDNKNGVLFFEDKAGQRDAVSAPELRVLLANSGVRLIVLDACESGSAMMAPFRSIGPALTASSVPAVVAMQFKVPEESTTAFAGEFYAALAEGHPIDACVTEGRKAVMGATGLRRPDWGIPVVYTRAPDGVLFKLPETRGQGAGGGININAPGANIGGNFEVNQGNVNVGGTDSTLSVDNVAREALEQQLKTKKRTYNTLKLSAARFGYSVPVHIILEIEDTVAQIRALERDLSLPPDPTVRVD